MYSTLTRLIVQDNAIIFIGTNLRATAGEGGAVGALAARLADELGEPHGRALALVAQDFEALHGRGRLLELVQETLHNDALSQTNNLHNLLADATLSHTKLITTRFDQALELALRQKERPYVRIVRDEDVSFFDESKVVLIKLRGDISQQDSLVITQADLVRFFQKLPTLSDVVRAFFATKTLIFIGYDLNDDLFSQFYQQLTQQLSTFRRTAYAVVSEPLRPAKAKFWAAQNMEILVENTAVFLQKLSTAVQATAANAHTVAQMTHNPLTAVAQPPLPAQPYKALDSFGAADVQIFTGRDEATQRLTNRILAHRLTVVYGESGSGKSSLIQAGVRPELARRRTLLAVTAPASQESLAEGWRVALHTAGQRANAPQPPADATLRAQIAHWQQTLEGGVVLAIDQFEQFWVAYDEGERTAVLDLLRQLIRDDNLNVYLVLIIREDFLGRLETLADRLPDPLGARFRLERLGREAARAAIEEPARLFGVRWEPALVEKLLADLQEPEGIAPPQLQIIADQLYRHVTLQQEDTTPAEPVEAPLRQAQGAGGAAAVAEPVEASVIRLADFTELGGTAVILGDYVDGVVKSLSGADQPIAQRVLGTLVSSQNVKQRLTLSEIQHAAETDKQTAARILSRLVTARLVRRLETTADENRFAYELTHDYLVHRIVRWLGEAFWDAQRAREILRDGEAGWQREGRLLAPTDLRLVLAQQDKLVFNETTTAVVWASAVAYGKNARPWAENLPLTTRQNGLLRLTTHPQASVRLHGTEALADPAFANRQVSTELVRLAVQDGDTTVRETAIRAIAATTTAENQFGFQRFVRLEAVDALAVMRDVNPAVAAWLPEALHGRVWRGTLALRWRRHRQDIANALARGALFGFVAFAIMGLVLFIAQAVDDPSLRGQWRLVILFVVAFGGLLGLIGTAAFAIGAGVQNSLINLRDSGQRTNTAVWLATVASTGVGLGLGLGLFYTIVAGTPDYAGLLLAGLGLSLGAVGGAAVPRGLDRRVRPGLAVAGGVLGTAVVSWLGWFPITTYPLWTILLGTTLGIAAYYTFRPRWLNK